jgi:ribokinase
MITVLGSINMDLIAAVSRLPKPGETIAGENFVTAPGGKGANQALAATRAGSNVVMAGAVGSDEFAVPALSFLKDAGTSLVSAKTVEGPTGVALIFVGGDGENVIAIIAGANGKVTEDDGRAAVAAMNAGDILMLQMEIPSATIAAAIEVARMKGVTTIVNTAPMTEDAVRLAALADIVIANETEFALFAGKAIPDAATREAEMERIHAERGQTLIVTLGADGVVAIRDTVFFRAAGLKIEPVDTVGAGDTFCGFLAAGLDQGMDFETSLSRAAIAGSIACTRHGAQPSVPDKAEVDRYC